MTAANIPEPDLDMKANLSTFRTRENIRPTSYCNESSPRINLLSTTLPFTTDEHLTNIKNTAMLKSL